MTIFQRYAQYYDLLYADKNYDQEVAYIDALCGHHGFELVVHEEWLTAQSLSCSSWGACFVCRKR